MSHIVTKLPSDTGTANERDSRSTYATFAAGAERVFLEKGLIDATMGDIADAAARKVTR